MALQLNNQYISIEDVSKDSIEIRIHADSNHRDRYKDGSETEFETTKGDKLDVSVDLEELADNTKSIKDNVLTAGYVALKATDEYASAQDV